AVYRVRDHRPAVLDPRRLLRRARRDRPGDRAARRGRAGDRRRVHRLLAYRPRGGRVRLCGADARGLRRAAEGAGRGDGPLAARRPLLGQRDHDPLRRLRGAARGAVRRGARHPRGRDRARSRPGRGGGADGAVPGEGRGRLELRAPWAPAPENEAAQGEAEAERADGEGADRERLPPGGEPLPATERLLLLGRERLAAALLAQRAAGANAQVEVVEYLRRV